jgi:predicted O-linked N-acetylglucosamine transferase (SPINDLY family)
MRGAQLQQAATLDEVLFNRVATAFDALGIGVPLMALESNRIVGRMADSMVRAVGRPSGRRHERG